jgi:hypothetical protein
MNQKSCFCPTTTPELHRILRKTTTSNLILTGIRKLGRHSSVKSVILLGTCKQQALPESEALPSVGLFAEYRNLRLCRELHSVKLGSRQRAYLPSAGHLAQDTTRQRHVCRVLNTR